MVKKLKRHKNRFRLMKRDHKNIEYVDMKEDFERQFLKIKDDLEDLRSTMIQQIYDFQGRVEACDDFIKELEAER
jgi:phosphopantetheine adenylyltransferase